MTWGLALCTTGLWPLSRTAGRGSAGSLGPSGLCGRGRALPRASEGTGTPCPWLLVSASTVVTGENEFHPRQTTEPHCLVCRLPRRGPGGGGGAPAPQGPRGRWETPSCPRTTPSSRPGLVGSHCPSRAPHPRLLCPGLAGAGARRHLGTVQAAVGSSGLKVDRLLAKSLRWLPAVPPLCHQRPLTRPCHKHRPQQKCRRLAPPGPMSQREDRRMPFNDVPTGLTRRPWRTWRARLCRTLGTPRPPASGESSPGTERQACALPGGCHRSRLPTSTTTGGQGQPRFVWLPHCSHNDQGTSTPWPPSPRWLLQSPMVTTITLERRHEGPPPPATGCRRSGSPQPPHLGGALFGDGSLEVKRGRVGGPNPI